MSAKKYPYIIALAIIIGLLGIAFVYARGTKPTAETSYESTPSDVSPTPASTSYIPYTKENYEANKDKKRVLFFFAAWCPTCNAANRDFLQNISKIPSDVVILKTDYDTMTELKKTYNIVTQHTFVLVDMQGNEIVKWNGGGTDELISYTYSQ